MQLDRKEPGEGSRREGKPELVKNKGRAEQAVFLKRAQHLWMSGRGGEKGTKTRELGGDLTNACKNWYGGNALTEKAFAEEWVRVKLGCEN